MEVMHGELFGIVTTLVRAQIERKQATVILTDYWNGLRGIRRILEKGGAMNGAGKAWYRWIWKVIDSLIHVNVVVEIRHVKAHTDEDSEDTNLKKEKQMR